MMKKEKIWIFLIISVITLSLISNVYAQRGEISPEDIQMRQRLIQKTQGDYSGFNPGDLTVNEGGRGVKYLIKYSICDVFDIKYTIFFDEF